MDFAFSIHTFLGTHCIGAKVNHRLEGLGYHIESGDQVEILTGKQSRVTKEWYNYATTAKARSKISAVLKRYDRDLQHKGEEILAEFFRSLDIERSPWDAFLLPERVGTGVPAQMLERRPDIMIADQVLAEAFYNTNAARAAFFPKISLQGILGWGNNSGLIANPGALLFNALASLTQPIFAQGKLIAQLKINKLTLEDMQRQYVQTVIDAGCEVNEALADCQVAKEKDGLYKRQIEVLQDAYVGTHELMHAGKASYLEVLTAQETLLTAQLNEATNLYNGSCALIELYIALGGATE